jgi:RNA polymerase sigma-70 factor (ECF subfamily)
MAASVDHASAAPSGANGVSRFLAGAPARGAGADRDENGLVPQAVAAAKEGQWDGIHYLYIRYADDVLGYVQSIVRDRYEAEDITQHVFAKLNTVIGKYEERSVPFAAWLMRVARNAALDRVRARRLTPVDEVRTTDRGDDRLSYERRQCLKEALAALPEEQRKVLVLRHVAGLSPAEIADRLGKTESSIHGLHHRGRATLKAALTDLGSGPVTAA